MAIEQFVNGAASTLGAGITNSATSLTVASATGFPTSGDFRIIVGTELIIVGAVSGTTFSSLTRGAEGSTAASHSSGDAVTHILTAGSLKASAYVGGLQLYPFTAWDDSAFAWVNQGTATISSNLSGGVFLRDVANSMTHRFRTKTAPATPYTIEMAFIPWLYSSNYYFAGFIWRNSSSGKFITSGANSANSGALDIPSGSKWDSPTSYVADYSHTQYASIANAPVWLRMTDDGTNRLTAFSLDGSNFVQTHSVARTDFITADQVGYGLKIQNVTYGAGMTILSWRQF